MCGWWGAITLGILSPIAFIWAYTNPDATLRGVKKAPEPEPETVRPGEAAAAAAAATVAATTVPAEPAESRALTQEELAKLKTTLFGSLTSYRFTFENFNENITITEVTIAVWDDLDPRGLKEYTETMHIPPSESAKVTYKVIYMGDDQGWRWKVDSAKGVPTVY